MRDPITNYTHNLRILLLDENDDIISNPVLMSQIYEELVDKDIRRGSRQTPMALFCGTIPITKTERHFIGDLFISTPNSDGILQELLELLIYEIDEKLRREHKKTDERIIFRVSKLLN